MTDEIRVPLVSYTRTTADERHTRLTYYVGNVSILEMDILKEYVPDSGAVSELTLVQLLVTPHEHLAVLADILSYAHAGKTSGPEWEALLVRGQSLLSPPG